MHGDNFFVAAHFCLHDVVSTNSDGPYFNTCCHMHVEGEMHGDFTRGGWRHSYYLSSDVARPWGIGLI